LIFVDTWAWVALAYSGDQYHAVAHAQHVLLQKSRRRYVTTDFVLGEVINHLYRCIPAAHAQAFVDSILQSADAGKDLLVSVSVAQFRRAWEMRQKYHDKPDISFVDFTSMVVMRDLGLAEIFTGDAHFLHVGLGFRLVP
jgi:predicted nucleic acid-binding protein